MDLIVNYLKKYNITITGVQAAIGVLVVYMACFIMLCVLIALNAKPARAEAGWQAEACLYNIDAEACKEQQKQEQQESRERVRDRALLQAEKQRLEERAKIAQLKRNAILAEMDLEMSSSPNYHRKELMMRICNNMSVEFAKEYLQATSDDRELSQMKVQQMARRVCFFELGEVLP